MGPTTRFPRARPWSRGYSVGQVDTFFTRALGQRPSADAVRRAGFELRLGGYDVEAVDAELDRLEDEASRAERDDARATLGERRFVHELTTEAQVLRARLARPHGDRFARGAWGTRSYDVGQVDDLCDEIAEYFEGQTALTVDRLRSAVFRPRRGSRGYAEEPVDRYVDRVVAVLSRVM
ncbi:MAG TPA: DivIVA domain-containing protein [Actinomycetales bacterium]|nr:DivIVA domain-containing protein [Actinomycetales bacterium]